MSWQDLLSKDLNNLEIDFLVDATITCGDKVWDVHKIIICRCEWFKKAFNGNFEEAKTNNVTISPEDFSSELVDAVITFIYSGSVDIEKLNTNNSVVDACVRLWVIADFFVLKELQNEVINLLDKYLDDKMKILCVVDANEVAASMTVDEYAVFLGQMFAGIKTAYTTFPHSLPCQQALVSFFHAARAIFFTTKHFSVVMASAPREFSHELLLATLDGRRSKWVMEEGPGYGYLERKDGCTGCGSLTNSHEGPWAVDPTSASGTQMIHVHWRCNPCLKKMVSRQPGEIT